MNQDDKCNRCGSIMVDFPDDRMCPRCGRNEVKPSVETAVEKIIRELWNFNASEAGFDLRPSELRKKLIHLGFTEAQLSKYYPWPKKSLTEPSETHTIAPD